MDRDQVVVVQETEYTGAGKHHNRQLSFARENGIEVRVGDPAENVPGKTIVLPASLEMVRGRVQDMDKLRLSYLKNAAKQHPVERWSDGDVAFLAADVKKDAAWVRRAAEDLA
jgi:hypothetical protein